MSLEMRFHTGLICSPEVPQLMIYAAAGHTQASNCEDHEASVTLVFLLAVMSSRNQECVFFSRLLGERNAYIEENQRGLCFYL